MPLDMDLHKGIPGIKKQEVEKAHMQDVAVQDKHQVKYHKFWINEEQGTIFCNLTNYDGREIKHTGDGIMATFNSTAKAVR